jgi:hypothetical protein
MIWFVLQSQTLLKNVSVRRMHILRNETLRILHVQPGASVRLETRLWAERPENRSSIHDGADVYSIHSGQSGTGVQAGCFRRGDGGFLYKGWEKVRILENLWAAAWKGRDEEREGK